MKKLLVTLMHGDEVEVFEVTGKTVAEAKGNAYCIVQRDFPRYEIVRFRIDYS